MHFKIIYEKSDDPDPGICYNSIRTRSKTPTESVKNFQKKSCGQPKTGRVEIRDTGYIPTIFHFRYVIFKNQIRSTQLTHVRDLPSRFRETTCQTIIKSN